MASEEGGRLGMFGGLQAQFGSALREGGDQARQAVERIISRLDIIAEGVLALGTEEVERSYEGANLAAGISKTVADGRAGWMVTIEHIAAVLEGAGSVDIYVGSMGSDGFRARLTGAAAGPVNATGLAGLKVPERAPILAVANGTGARVNLQIKRERVA